MVKFEFEDKSFLQFFEISGKINIVMCGKKDHNSTVMSSYALDIKQTKELIKLLEEFIKKGS